MHRSNADSPAPIQLYHLCLDGGRCETIAPDAALADAVHFYWLMEVEAEKLELQIIPDAATDLVVSPTLPHFAAIFLPQATRLTLSLSGPIRYFGVSFAPLGLSRLLGSDVETLATLQVGEHTITNLEIGTLIAELQGRPSLGDARALFDAFFLERQRAHDGRAPRPGLEPQSLFTLIADTVGQRGVDTVCRTLDISDRQCRRLSTELLGLSPKKLQSVLRLQAALRELIDLDAGARQDLYYDDSHRIRELKSLTGLTPGQIRRVAEIYNS